MSQTYIPLVRGNVQFNTIKKTLMMNVFSIEYKF